MALGDADTSTYGPAPNYGSDAVEAWRPSITKNAGTLPVEFLLAWVAFESGGNPCDWETSTGSIEVGIFQLMSPDNISAGNTSIADQQPSPPCPASSPAHGSFAQLSDDQVEAMVVGGINYVNYCVGYAINALSTNGYNWSASSPDYWAAVKMVHVAPGALNAWLASVAASSASNGTPLPSTWAAMYAAAVANSAPWSGNSHWANVAGQIGQYGAGGNSVTNIFSNTLSSLQYMTLAEWLLMGLAVTGGVAGAFFLNRWLQSGIASTHFMGTRRAGKLAIGDKSQLVKLGSEGLDGYRVDKVRALDQSVDELLAQPITRDLPMNEVRTRLSALSAKLSELRDDRPRPIKKLYGQRGPTPEQLVEYKEETKIWNRAYRRATKAHQEGLEISNEKFRQGLDGYRVAYLQRADRGPHLRLARALDPQEAPTLESAQKLLKGYKRQGFTAWVEDDAGAFVPVKGATRKPGGF